MLRNTLRRLPHRVSKLSTTPIVRNNIKRNFHPPANNMSLFPRFQEFSPLFRLLDDYDRVARGAIADLPQNIRSFNPKFDVKELKDSYELHGELPGVEQKDINIEWTDGNTLTISGRTEHRAERGQPPQGFIEGEAKEASKKASVEDEQANKGKESTAVAKQAGQEVQKKGEEEAKYWVTERSVGEFHRSFSFPTRVDQDNVKASLKNGVLSIVVPKAQAPKPRKIQIE